MSYTSDDLFDAEMEANNKAFKEMPFKDSDKGKFVLLRKRKLITVCDTHSECCVLGDEQYADGLYSVQEIGYDFEEDLGFQGCVFLR